MFFAFKVNAAIDKLGVSIKVFDGWYRSSMHSAGKASGNSAEEVALFMVAQLPVIHRTEIDTDLIRQWSETGKIDAKRDEVRSALAMLSLWDLM